MRPLVFYWYIYCKILLDSLHYMGNSTEPTDSVLYANTSNLNLFVDLASVILLKKYKTSGLLNEFLYFQREQDEIYRLMASFNGENVSDTGQHEEENPLRQCSKTRILSKTIL